MKRLLLPWSATIAIVATTSIASAQNVPGWAVNRFEPRSVVANGSGLSCSFGARGAPVGGSVEGIGWLFVTAAVTRAVTRRRRREPGM